MRRDARRRGATTHGAAIDGSIDWSARSSVSWNAGCDVQNWMPKWKQYEYALCSAASRFAEEKCEP